MPGHFYFCINEECSEHQKKKDNLGETFKMEIPFKLMCKKCGWEVCPELPEERRERLWRERA